MGVVTPAHQRQALRCPQQTVDRGIAQMPTARRLQALLGGGAVQNVQHPAMGHQGDVLAQVLPARNVDWLGQPETIKPVVALVVFWRYVGFNTILYVAAMQAIPRDLYEAARMDGARGWRIFWHITLPQLKPMMYFGVTLTVIGGLQLFEEPFILTGGRGGTDQSGMTTAMYMYRTAFDFNDFGTASALSWILFVFVAVLTWLTNLAFKSNEGEA